MNSSTKPESGSMSVSIWSTRSRTAATGTRVGKSLDIGDDQISLGSPAYLHGIHPEVGCAQAPPDRAVLARKSSEKPSRGPRTTFSVCGSSIPLLPALGLEYHAHSRAPSMNRAASPVKTCSTTLSMQGKTAICPDGDMRH